MGDHEDIIDLEEFARDKREKPKTAKHWRIRIDKTQYVVDKPCMTGRELLTLAGKVPVQQFRLMQRFHDGRVEQIGLDQEVCFYAPGIERFVTIPLDQTDGSGEPLVLRRQFNLPAQDLEFLTSVGLAWETTIENGQHWVLFKDYPIRPEYAQGKVDVALLLPPGYRDCQIDMVYFFPGLTRIDGKPINATAGMVIDGKNWQRWSRHRTESNPWRPGVDDISTHMRLVDYWLEREIRR